MRGRLTSRDKPLDGAMRPLRPAPDRHALTLTLAVALVLVITPMPAHAGAGVQAAANTAGIPAAQDEPDPPTAAGERAMKAAFLYRFLGYVDFPTGPLAPGAPYMVGVAGADDIAAELTRLTSGRMVNNHAVVVRKMHDGDPAGGLHLLFIGAADGAGEAALARAAQLAGALSVTESATGIESGGVINFLLIDERVRFEVSLAAADKGRLKLSSRLLSVAYAVHKGGG